MIYRSMYKSDLAAAAGVSDSTFRRWLHEDRQVLATMGVSPRRKKLPPQVVKWICEKYVITPY